MGTRGFLGFLVDGQEKITYNHFDSYPDGLGLDVLYWLQGVDKGEAREKARALTLVKEDEPPTPSEVLALAQYANTSVGNQGIHNTVVHDWYQLLRNTQGNPQAILDAGYMIDNHEFAEDSLFCEWGYLVNFDDRTLEVYRGFQNQPHDNGRFAQRSEGRPTNLSGTYYPVALIATYRFGELPTDNQFVKDLSHDDDED